MQLGKPMCNVHVNYLMPRMHVTRQADHWLKDKLVAFPRNRSHDHVQRVNSSLIFPVSKSMPSKILLFLTRHIHNAYLVQIKALNHASLIELTGNMCCQRWVFIEFGKVVMTFSCLYIPIHPQLRYFRVGEDHMCHCLLRCITPQVANIVSDNSKNSY